ncbi:MAG: glutamine--fructose-6-phosphate transaminase (isomerizing) [Chloroflexi bacterium]|nr:glutamine--fructose-6-phosphate transaminase (isomerizing) [Chloroflexota bacterium]
MCGIVGYIGSRDVSTTLIEGLRLLEYRGYDSAGIAVAATGGEISMRKRAGRLANLEGVVGELPTGSIAGIAHTRWATHGAPTDLNAHPHMDEHGEIAIIHNGIIENYAELQRELTGKGHTLSSDVDTEVIAHLIEDAYQGDIRLAVAAVLPRLRGQWALVVMHRGEPGRIIAARREAPLAVGIGEGEQFLASDPVAMLEHTNKIIFLRDGDLADLQRDGVTLYDATGTTFASKIETITWDGAAARKEGYDHFMRKEMDQQPRALSAAMLGRVSATGIAIGELDSLGAALTATRSIEFVACGSAYHASLCAATLAERLLRIPVRVTVASEFRYDPPALGPTSLVIAVSQSGETADTLGAVRIAKAAGAPVLAIVNAAGSSLTREADAVVLLQAGTEISVAATKSYTSQALVSLLVTLDLARRTGALTAADARAWAEELLRVPAMASAALDASDALPSIAAKYFGASGFMFVSRGAGIATALEGALKLKEISYIHAEGIAAGEMKHGPISLLGADHPVVAVVLNSPVLPKLVSNLMESRARSAPVIAILSGVDDWSSFATDAIVIPAARPEIAALIATIPLQRFSYEMALLAGADIDQPQNLAKSVTVE